MTDGMPDGAATHPPVQGFLLPLDFFIFQHGVAGIDQKSTPRSSKHRVPLARARTGYFGRAAAEPPGICGSQSTLVRGAWLL